MSESSREAADSGVPGEQRLPGGESGLAAGVAHGESAGSCEVVGCKPKPARGGLTWDTTYKFPVVPSGTTTFITGPSRPLFDDPPSEFEEAVLRTFNEARHLLLSKHKMYSGKNIAQSPGGPLNGLRVRIWDKVARLNNIIEKDLLGSEEHESLEDTFIDLLNYSAIALMVLREQWPNE